MTPGSGLGDKPPPRDSNKDGGSLIGERLYRLLLKLCFASHLQVRDWFGISECLRSHKPHVSLER